MLRSTIHTIVRITAAVALLLVAAAVLIRQPTATSLPFPGSAHSDASVLRRHVETLAGHRSPDYIASAFRAEGATVVEQTFTARRKTYRNVIATFGHGDPLLVIGAHYDAFDDLPGADDNASGAAGLLELGRMLARTQNLSSEVMLVAYANEEPPFFASDDMGSAVHAASLAGRPVKMICLEMIGYYTVEQPWATWTFRALFPSHGDFVAVAGGWRDVALTREVKRALAGAGMEVASATLPHSMIDASHQRNYSRRGSPPGMGVY